MNLIKKLGREIGYYSVDVSATMSEVNPVFATFEVGIVGMSDDVSMKSRLTATAIGFGGIGYLFSRGRDFSRKIFKITDETKEKIIKFHDSAYAAAFTLACSPCIYYFSGARDYKEIAIGAGVATVVGYLNGGLVGCSIDVFRDLTGLKECDRKFYPDLIKKRNPKIKKLIGAGLIGASIATVAGIYALTPDKFDSVDNAPVRLEERVE